MKDNSWLSILGCGAVVKPCKACRVIGDQETCESIADDPSWYDELKYFKL